MDDTRVEMDFGDGRYSFWLPMPLITELERKSGRAFLAIEHSIREAVCQDGDDFGFMGGGSCPTQDILDVVRLGLQGGNSGLVDGEQVEVGPERARQLVAAYCYPMRPLEETVMHAFRIATTAVVGVRLKKKVNPE